MKKPNKENCKYNKKQDYQTIYYPTQGHGLFRDGLLFRLFLLDLCRLTLNGDGINLHPPTLDNALGIHKNSVTLLQNARFLAF